MATIRKTKYYKVLSLDGCSKNGGKATWSMPGDDKSPGGWMPKIKNVKACARGYHLIPHRGLKSWATSDNVLICEAEGRGKSVRPSFSNSDGKVAFAEARIIRVIGRTSKRQDKWEDGASTKIMADARANPVKRTYVPLNPPIV